MLFYFDKKNIYTYTNFCNKNETVDGWRRINYQTSTNSMEDKIPDIVGRFVLYSAFQFPIKKKREEHVHVRRNINGKIVCCFASLNNISKLNIY